LFQCFLKWKLLFYAQLIQIGVSQQWYICFINSSKLKNSFTILETQKKKSFSNVESTTVWRHSIF
jgi:hypothetical protein